MADSIPIKQFEKLRSFLCFVDNATNDQKNADKLFKIRPVIESVRQQCLQIPPEESHSIDEQIIPGKTKYSGMRQYNPKKPKKWGFKNLVQAGASGIMYDFYTYTGKQDHSENDTPYSHLQTSAQVVAQLCENLPTHANHKLYFDNWFTKLQLPSLTCLQLPSPKPSFLAIIGDGKIQIRASSASICDNILAPNSTCCSSSWLQIFWYLKKKGILLCGTVHTNHLAGCPILSNKKLKKLGCGSLDSKSDMNSGLIVMKWMDNGPVHVASNYLGIVGQYISQSNSCQLGNWKANADDWLKCNSYPKE